MQYQKSKFSFLALMMFSCALFVFAQETSQPKNPKPQRPTKHPTQFDKIIDTENTAPSETKEKSEAAPATPVKTVLPTSDALVQAVENLTGEVKNLVNEVRATSARQQMQTDILRLSRLDLRIDRYESELKTVRDRLTILNNDQQTLQSALTPEGLEVQVSRMPYASKSEAIRQVKENLEARLRVVNAERELVVRREAELVGILKGFLEANAATEKRLQAIEEKLKKLTEPEAGKDEQEEKPKEN